VRSTNAIRLWAGDGPLVAQITVAPLKREPLPPAHCRAPSFEPARSASYGVCALGVDAEDRVLRLQCAALGSVVRDCVVSTECLEPGRPPSQIDRHEKPDAQRYGSAAVERRPPQPILGRLTRSPTMARTRPTFATYRPSGHRRASPSGLRRTAETPGISPYRVSPL